MSDTPRTDVEAEENGLNRVVSADFARQLERELAEARRDAERLEHLMARHRLALYNMVTGMPYQGTLTGDEYRTRMRAAIDEAMKEK